MTKILLFLFTIVNAGYINFASADTACFEVEGMTCATCPITVKAAVKKLKGINNVVASLKEKNAVVEFDSQKTNVTQIKTSIDSVGYNATLQECKK